MTKCSWIAYAGLIPPLRPAHGAGAPGGPGRGPRRAAAGPGRQRRPPAMRGPGDRAQRQEEVRERQITCHCRITAQTRLNKLFVTYLKCSNIDIIAMLRSGSLPSTFRHHFGPHVESIVGELLVATEPQNAGGGSQSSAIVVEYYSAGRLVE